MKKFCLLAFILLITRLCFSQNGIYYKAEFLNSFYSSITNKITIDDNGYGAIKDLFPGLDKDQTIAELNKNPFLLGMVAKKAGSGITAFNFSASSVAGLDVTKYANAIADIMIERAKQELTIAFFNRFKKFSEEHPEFKILFPKSTDNLSNLLTFSYTQMLPALRKGFFEDLEKITYHLDDVLELPKYQHLLKNFPQVTIAIRSIRLIHELETKTSTAADIINKFAAFKEWSTSGNADFNNMGSTIRFAAIFSESLRYKDATRIWVSNDDIKELVTNDVFTKIFIGLIYQQAKISGIKFQLDATNPGTTTNLEDILAAQKDNIIIFQTKIAEFINLSEKVKDSYDEVAAKKSKKEKITNDDIYNYINVSIDVTDYAFSVLKIFNKNLTSDKYLNIAKKSSSLYKDIYSKQYTQAVNDAIDVLNEVHDLTEKNTTVVVFARTGIELDKKSALDTLLDFIKKVKPYALFMANMVEAKDDKEVKAALENVILPVGSSSIKKNTVCNVSVQTYLGAFLSFSNPTASSGGIWGDKFGVTAPIGISWTPEKLSWGRGGCISLFVSLFDLGAIVDYKLKKETVVNNQGGETTVVAKDYSVKLGQLFSPGGYIVYGFPGHLPLSLGWGGQYGPGLSKVAVEGTTVTTNPSWRFNLFLAVDLPFFNLVNKTKHQ